MNKWILGIILLGIILRGVLVLRQPYPLAAHEASNFVEYAEIIKKEWRIPDPNECWVCYHPPLYMLSATIFSESADKLFGGSTATHVQIFSFLLSIVFMFLSQAYLRMILKPESKNEMKIFYLIFSFLIFWPSVVMNTVRIGNESLNYIWLLCFLICFQKWIDAKNKKLLAGALLAIVLVYFTKSSWMIPVGIISAYYFLKRIRLRWLIFTGCMIMALEAGMQAHGKGVFPIIGTKLVPNMAGLPNDLRVSNSIGTLFGFSFPFYFNTAISDPLKHPGRDYFWSFFLRTARTGEFAYEKSNHVSAFALMIFFLMIVLRFIEVAIRLFKEKWPPIPVLDLTMSLFALMAMRLSVPYACAQDMRYITVSFVSFVALIGWVMIRLQNRKWLLSGFSVQLVILIASSIIFLFSI